MVFKESILKICWEFKPKNLRSYFNSHFYPFLLRIYPKTSKNFMR
ncbi:hypothetical protein G436_4117 [Leptospira interrogans serovar Hardjo str. Norma]|uniref:Uncharacterized protein n=1 Tax=Leptospira interrogans serovar Hardjo str. Norma TaxID=1279460 RepID=A0A0M4P1U6_LEPIR|nr:hypothetical protein G436_4117 [Leptospira interrogans serovar Hardjo str. Norma]